MKIKIPRKYFEIRKEKRRPTTFIQHRKTGQMRGRLERGDKLKGKGLVAGKKLGRTRVIRMKKDFGSLKKGQIIARTKKIYPRQVNSVLIRKGKTGRIRGVTVVKEHDRRSKKGKKHIVKKHKRQR